MRRQELWPFREMWERLSKRRRATPVSVEVLEGRQVLTGVFQEFPVAPDTLVGIYQITRGPEGNLWFVDDYGGVLGRITPDGKITKFGEGLGVLAGGIVTGADGNIWFSTESTATGQAGMGRITPDGQITLFPLSESAEFPELLAASPDGSLWFASTFSDRIGRMTPNGNLQNSLFTTRRPQTQLD